MVKFLALHGDMRAQGVCCGIGATFLKGCQDRFMLGHGLGHPSAQAQLQPSEGVQALEEAQGFGLQKTVAGLGINHPVEGLVAGVVGV